jgi:soluble lytic murein transglycosylase-like protein
MQVMPRDGIAANFVCQNGPCFASRPTIQELEDPDYNITYGTRMLAGLVKRLGNLRDALKAYGPMDVGYSYADTVLSLYQSYRED